MKNARKGVVCASALTLLLFLSSCGGGFSAAPYAFDVGLDPNPLGFNVTIDQTTGIITYIIPSHTLVFASRAGGVGATIEGYELEYFEASRNPAFPGDSVQRSQGSLNVRVPPGIVCPAPEEGDVDVCTVNTDGVVFSRGEAVSSQASFLLPIDIAAELYDLVGVGGAVGAYAEITFFGTDDLQRPFESEPYEFAIAIPVEGGAGGDGGEEGEGGEG